MMDNSKGGSSRYSTFEPEISAEDMESIGDKALGLLPGDGAGLTLFEANAYKDMEVQRYKRIGSKLSARQAMSHRRKGIFIRTLALTGIVGRAATAAGWTNSAVHSMRKNDKEFAAMWENAIEFSTDALEEAARGRAIDGVTKPIYQQGRLVGHVQEYSDALLTTLLKAKRPKEYRDNVAIEANVKGGVLVVPGVLSESAWEAAASSNQAQHRTHTGDDTE